MDTGFKSANWPEPSHPERLETQLASWTEAVGRIEAAEDRAFVEGLADDPSGRAMLDCVFGSSPFLGSCLLAEPAYLHRLWNDGAGACVDAALAGLAALPPDLPQAATGVELRIARRRVALAAALADIAGLWEPEEVTGSLSRLADRACSTTLRVLLSRLHARNFLALPDPEDPERDSGLITLGLGKLGGNELNYSSDIDLILLYDPDRLPARDPSETLRHLLRLARNFIALLAERTREGYVFRVDLRLRPDPAATPLVMSTEAAENYYEARGQTWERSALIKARPIAGDISAGHAFLTRIEPFVWRRHLDFATVQELHDMKKQIDAHHGSGAIRTLGHNLKLGRGGIREIEFFAQAHQLVWGGKDCRLRTIPTCTSLRNLTAAGRIPEAATESFVRAYRFLRRAEHRVQMVADEQIHSLPADPDEYAALTRFLGYPDPDRFTEELTAVLRGVERHYADFFELPVEVSSSRDARPTIDAAQLGRMGFANPEAGAGILGKWRSGRYRVAQGPRSRELLDALTPALLTAMLGSADPDLAFTRFDRFLAGLPTGLQVFSLFQANLHVMETLVDILVSAPAVGEQLMRRPELFETLLEWDAAEIAPGRAQLEEELRLQLGPARDLEDAVGRTGSWVHAARLRVAIHMLFRRLGPVNAAPVLSDVADCALGALLNQVQNAFARNHGRIPGAETAILGMGRLGGREMSVTSDLDLVLVYDAPENAESDGSRPLAAPSYYNRLLRRLLGVLDTGYSDVGRIYEIDMRLRPSGNAGPLATSLTAFDAYHAENAWTWEAMALTRARVAHGPERITNHLVRTIAAALAAPRDPETLRRDVLKMRERMDREFHTEDPWSVKHYRGGLVDIEFIAQYLLLRTAPERPEVLATNTGQALANLARSGALEQPDAEILADAWTLWTRVQALQRLIRNDVGADDIPTGLRPLFAEAADLGDFGELAGRMAATADAVRAAYARILGTPAESDPDPQ